MLKYIYFGTPEISLNVLKGLVDTYDKPAMIITAPDKKSGRGMKMTASPLKSYAIENNILYLTPQKLNDIQDEIESVKANVGILFAYGKIIPKWLLDVFPYGIVNVHPSILPYYRGASPLVGPFLNGELNTGITIMDMDTELDHGPIYLQKEINLDESSNRLDLENIVQKETPELLTQVLNGLESKTVQKKDQNHAVATYTTKIKREDGLLRENDTDETKYRKYKAYINWPGVYFYKNIDGKELRIKINKAHTKNGVFVIDTVTPENGKEIKYSDFANQ